MDKEEWISVGVKLFGIYLIVLAIIELPLAIGNVWQYTRIMDHCGSDVEVTGTQEAIEWGKRFCETFETKSIKSSLALIFYLIFGVYFIRSGRLVKNILYGDNT